MEERPRKEKKKKRNGTNGVDTVNDCNAFIRRHIWVNQMKHFDILWGHGWIACHPKNNSSSLSDLPNNTLNDQPKSWYLPTESPWHLKNSLKLQYPVHLHRYSHKLLKLNPMKT